MDEFTYVGDVQDGKSVISIEDPVAGEWTLNAEDLQNAEVISSNFTDSLTIVSKDVKKAVEVGVEEKLQKI